MKSYQEFKEDLSEAKKYMDTKNYNHNKKIYKNLKHDDILKAAQNTSDKTEKGFITAVANMYDLSRAEATKAWKAYKKEPELYNPNPSVSEIEYNADS